MNQMSMKLRKTEEHWRENVVGMPFKARFNEELLNKHFEENLSPRHEIQMDLLKRKRAGEKISLLPSLQESCSIAIIDRGKYKAVGFNTPEDLTTNNLGSLLAKTIFRTPNTATITTFTLVDNTNTTQTFSDTTSNGVLTQASTGARGQVGNGTHTASRSDICLKGTLTTAPESSIFSMVTSPSPAGFTSTGAIATGGIGSILECVLYGAYVDTGAINRTTVLCRDNISPVLPFSAGNSIVLTYTFNT